MSDWETPCCPSFARRQRRRLVTESRNDQKDAESFPWEVLQDPRRARAVVTALEPNSKVFVQLGISKQGPPLQQRAKTMYHGTTVEALEHILGVLGEPARIKESEPIWGRTDRVKALNGECRPLWGVYVAPHIDTAEGYCFKCKYSLASAVNSHGAILHLEVPETTYRQEEGGFRWTNYLSGAKRQYCYPTESVRVIGITFVASERAGAHRDVEGMRQTKDQDAEVRKKKDKRAKEKEQDEDDEKQQEKLKKRRQEKRKKVRGKKCNKAE